MLTLGAPSAQTTVTLAKGVSVTVRPATSVDVLAAEGEAARLMKAALDGAALTEILQFGVSSDGPDLNQAPIRAAWTRFVIDVLLAEQVISAWDGIGDASGSPIAPNRAAIAALLQDPVRRRPIMTAIEAPLHAVEDEAKK
ncbi:MAG: hypothetical protein AAF234_15975 [Pseudomonadota bacterium]